MFHPNRRHRIRDVKTVDALVELVLRPRSQLEVGYRIADTLFLNDSTTADAVQIYSVRRAGREIDAVAFGACTRGEAAAYIHDLVPSVTVGSQIPAP